MRVILITVLMFSFSLAALPVAPEVKRPQLLGVAKMTIRVRDLGTSTIFYRDLLGFQVIGTKRASRRFRVNERQSIEVTSGLDPAQDRLISVTLQTDQVEVMRRYLAARGWRVPATIPVNQWGERVLQVADPEGRGLEFIELPAPKRQMATTLSSQSVLRQISHRIMHAGIIVTSIPPALDFYTGRLALREFWRGSGRDSKYLSWINMRLPESEDYLELMLYGEDPPGDRRGSAHHLCLEVPDIEAARKSLESNPGFGSYKRPIEIRVGVNRRRQLNLFDPDGTRSELMEPRTIDGVPPVSSTAPYPER